MPLLFSPINSTYDSSTSKTNRKTSTTNTTILPNVPRLSNSQEFVSNSATSSSRRLLGGNKSVTTNRLTTTTTTTMTFNKQNQMSASLQFGGGSYDQQKSTRIKRDSIINNTSISSSYKPSMTYSQTMPSITSTTLRKVQRSLQKSKQNETSIDDTAISSNYKENIVSMAPLSNSNLTPHQLIESTSIISQYDTNCCCNLCQIDKKSTSVEIIPKGLSNQQKQQQLQQQRENVVKVVNLSYSKLYTQISSLKLFNLMNTDCSVYYDNTITNTNTDQQMTEQFLHVNSNRSPIYDPRYLYLIDCRIDRKKYELDHINTAIHYTDLLNENIYLSPPIEHYTIIVLYDDDGAYLESLITNTRNNAAPVSAPPTQNDRRKSAPLSKNILIEIRKLLNNFNNTIYILTNGFDGFKTTYPFMCSNLQIRSTVDRHKYLTIYPNCVLENFLFIGSGIQAKNWKIIRDLNITHIINSSIEHECVFQDACKYLHVKIEDNLNENIYNELDNAFNFIENALNTYRKNMDTVKVPKILIHCNLGISRSSSILIAYLIKKYKFCLYSTFNYVKDKRIQIAPNNSFLKQLKYYEDSIL